MPYGSPPRSATRRRNAPDAATDIEHAPARLEPGPLERGLVGGQLPIFAERPGGGAGAPERSPTVRASGRGG